MKKFLMKAKKISALMLVALMLLPVGCRPAENKPAKRVYICTGTYATKYHKTRKCRGLKNCKGKIKSISFEKAERMHRTPCKICYKN